VRFLTFFFFFLLGEGVFLGGSGFLPPEVDEFALNVVYPAFSPSVLAFLGFAAIYGVWKAGQE
jgi:hypothetical protein